jgi:hypothetical protein
VKDTGILGEVAVASLSKTHSVGDEGAHVCADAGGNIEGGVTGVRKIRVGGDVAGVGRRRVAGGVAGVVKNRIGGGIAGMGKCRGSARRSAV